MHPSRKNFPFFQLIAVSCLKIATCVIASTEKLPQTPFSFINCGALSSGTLLKAFAAADFNQSSSDYKVALWYFILKLCCGNPEAFNSLWKEATHAILRSLQTFSNFHKVSDLCRRQAWRKSSLGSFLIDQQHSLNVFESTTSHVGGIVSQSYREQKKFFYDREVETNGCAFEKCVPD